MQIQYTVCAIEDSLRLTPGCSLPSEASCFSSFYGQLNCAGGAGTFPVMIFAGVGNRGMGGIGDVS